MVLREEDLGKAISGQDPIDGNPTSLDFLAKPALVDVDIF
jgi:hypothetical protein